jgi:spore photoproduct lyase
MPWKPRKILIEREVADTPAAESVLSQWPDAPVERLDRIKDYPGPLDSRDVAVARNRGRFIKKCPCTPAYKCCGYYILNLGIGCRLDCTYCYLHHYMNTPFTIYANTDELIAEAVDHFSSRPERTFRVGSGEFIDSLDFDAITGINRQIIPALSSVPNIVFEIKTKTDRVSDLLALDHHGRVVVSWSVNPESVRRTEEPGSAPLASRLAAAAECVIAGYRVGFHFDPLIHYPGWDEDYTDVVSAIFACVPADRIAWISLGALRFHPSLKPIMEKKFPDSSLTAGELIRGLDGKFRYFITIRRRMFREVNKAIREHGPNVPVYLCMESRALADEAGIGGL